MDDFTLVRRSVEGDDEAWGRLVERHAPKVRGTVLELLGELPEFVADSMSPEDLVVEVFNSLLEDDCRRLRRVGDQADVAAWLQLIARRLTLKRSRRSLRVNRVSTKDLEEPIPAEAERLRAAVRKQISVLPPRDRLVVQLFLFEGVDAARVAQHVGLPEAQVVRFLERFVADLKARMRG